jgi:hypothetical protein
MTFMGVFAEKMKKKTGKTQTLKCETEIIIKINGESAGNNNNNNNNTYRTKSLPRGT